MCVIYLAFLNSNKVFIYGIKKSFFFSSFSCLEDDKCVRQSRAHFLSEISVKSKMSTFIHHTSSVDIDPCLVRFFSSANNVPLSLYTVSMVFNVVAGISIGCLLFADFNSRLVFSLFYTSMTQQYNTFYFHKKIPQSIFTPLTGLVL